MEEIRQNHEEHRGIHFGRLSRAQCEQLHDASLEILNRTGAQLHDQEAIDLLKRAGANVADGNRVRIPARLVERALATAPKEVTLYDRTGRPAIRAGGYRCYYGTGSDCLNILDHRTGERRRAALRDVVEGAVVGDALEHVDFVMSMFLPADVEPMASDRYQMQAMLDHTTKPIIYVTNAFPGTADAVEMAEIVAGGAAALQERPFAACYINVTTGLRHNPEALQKLLFLSRKGLPFTYVPSCQGGATAPITQAAGAAMANAGALVGLVLSQLTREGTGFVMPGWSGESLDMRTLVEAYVFPNHSGLAQSLAHFYDLPMFGIGGCSDAKGVDQQAAAEAALSLMSETLGGSHIIHDLGYLESGLCGSLAQLAICDEIVGWLQRYAAPVEITDETLALDLIDEKGPDGQYLDSEHTLRHFRDRWYPELFERANYERWLESGSRTLVERAAERVDEILAGHRPESLPPDVQQAVGAVVQRAEEGM